MNYSRARKQKTIEKETAAKEKDHKIQGGGGKKKKNLMSLNAKSLKKYSISRLSQPGIAGTKKVYIIFTPRRGFQKSREHIYNKYTRNHTLMLMTIPATGYLLKLIMAQRSFY